MVAFISRLQKSTLPQKAGMEHLQHLFFSWCARPPRSVLSLHMPCQEPQGGQQQRKPDLIYNICLYSAHIRAHDRSCHFATPADMGPEPWGGAPSKRHKTESTFRPLQSWTHLLFWQGGSLHRGCNTRRDIAIINIIPLLQIPSSPQYGNCGAAEEADIIIIIILITLTSTLSASNPRHVFIRPARLSNSRLSSLESQARVELLTWMHHIPSRAEHTPNIL